jgi:hypothetical protein
VVVRQERLFVEEKELAVTKTRSGWADLEGLLGWARLSCFCLAGITPGLTLFQASRVSPSETAQKAMYLSGIWMGDAGSCFALGRGMLNCAQRRF